MGQVTWIAVRRRIQLPVDQGLSGTARGRWDDLGLWVVPQHLLRGDGSFGTRLQDLERRDVAEDESAAESQLPHVHAFHGNRVVGEKVKARSTCPQLRSHAQTVRRTANEGSIASSGDCALGEDVREASNAEAAVACRPRDSGEYAKRGPRT